ncbi:MAG: hypothetical protein N3B16_11290 [Candidatus Aminicenantes bacterium]|nr:hypothetical protein [Candidatus Aminicenantes bacterium]
MKGKRRILKLSLIPMLISLTISCLIYIPFEERWPESRETYPSPERRQSFNQIDTTFIYNYLATFGYWVYLSPYGHVWIPRYVPYNWRPYTHGRWVWTEAGWLWVSNFEWGWLVFHYGRWGWHNRLGWFWVPGTIWAPAWVIWAWSDLYVGWAPIPPEIDWIPEVGLAVIRIEPPWHGWIFVEGRYFLTSYLDRYVLPPERNRTILNFTVNKRSLVPRGTTIFNEGVEPSLVSKWTKTEVRKYELREASRPVRESIQVNTVIIPRPSISKSEVARPNQIHEPEKVQQELEKERPRLFRFEQFEMERERLERSQKEEENYLKRKMEEEKSQVRDEVAKQEIERRYKTQLEQLKKHHQEERKELEERQEEQKKRLSGDPGQKKKAKNN